MEPQKPPDQPDRGPREGTRLLCWFGIYFAAQLPFIMYAAGFYLFPIGLLAPFLPS